MHLFQRESALSLDWNNILKRKKYFVWDFDGCFCDSEPFHFRAYAQAFLSCGHTVKEDEYYPSFTHLGGGVPREIEKYNLACSPDDIMERKKHVFWTLITERGVPLFPEISPIIAATKRHGIMHAIASNSPCDEIEAMMADNPIAKQLTLVVGKTPHLRKKPAPDIFLHTLGLLHAKPEDVLILEDSSRGLEAAQAAGIDAIWILTRFNQNLHTQARHLAAVTHSLLLDGLTQMDSLHVDG